MSRQLPALVQTLCVLGLGLFWGSSPALSKLMGEAGIPITHIVAGAGVGVGLGLALLRLAQSGRFGFDHRAAVYGLVCGLLMNIPWCLSLFLVRKMPVSVYAVITATAPLCSYVLAVLLGQERIGPLRVLALLAGFLSSLVLIATRPDASFDGITSWALLAFAGPVLWAVYNNYASFAWPRGMDTLTAGIVESWASALLVLPFLLVLEPISGAADLHAGYWLLALAVTLWIIERIAFFTMIRGAGPVTTGQATYVSTPASVVFGMLLFKEHADAWLLASVGLLLLALWLNNRAVLAARGLAT